MGPLEGFTIIEIAGLGPAPFAGMKLADMGATVIRVERPGGGNMLLPPEVDFMNRNKNLVIADLKTPEGVQTIIDLAKTADGFIEGFRPGKAEQLGIGPEDIMAINPAMVYGRMTGWGQEGPLAQTAGHDINYIGLSGALYHMGEAGQKPTIPLALVGDFGGGGMHLAFGMVCGILEAQNSGKGQVVDAAMVDGAASLMTMCFGAYGIGYWSEDRGTNIIDSGSHFYNVYECADGEYVACGAVEPQFYSQLIDGLGLANEDLPNQLDQEHWPAMKQRFTELFKTKTRDQWCAIFAGTDACVTPVLKMSEVKDHPHIQARQTMIQQDGYYQPAPSPKFSRTEPEIIKGAEKIPD